MKTYKETWKQTYRVLRTHTSMRRSDDSTIGRRSKMHRHIHGAALFGWVGIYWNGRDCDGQHWSNSHAMRADCPRAIEQSIDSTTDYLDGPAAVYIDAPNWRDVAYAFEYSIDN